MDKFMGTINTLMDWPFGIIRKIFTSLHTATQVPPPHGALSKFVRNVTVGQRISDHFAVKCQLALKEPGSEKKEVTFRRLN